MDMAAAEAVAAANLKADGDAAAASGSAADAAQTLQLDGVHCPEPAAAPSAELLRKTPEMKEVAPTEPALKVNTDGAEEVACKDVEIAGNEGREEEEEEEQVEDPCLGEPHDLPPSVEAALQSEREALKQRKQEQDGEDFRRKQLQERAQKQKEKQQDRQDKKDLKKKAAAEKVPAPKGRPRKSQAVAPKRKPKQDEEPTEPPAKKRRGKKAEAEAAAAAAEAEKRLDDMPQIRVKAKAKATAEPKSLAKQPKAKAKGKGKKSSVKPLDRSLVDEALKQKAILVLKKYPMDYSYDRATDDYHKADLPRDLRLNTYWSRPACGLTQFYGEGSKSDIFYFAGPSGAKLPIQLLIWCCLEMAVGVQENDVEWADSEAADNLKKMVFESARAAAGHC